MEEPGLIQSILDYIVQHAHGLGAVVLFCSSLIEYVFPPFPGDVITLFGAWLVVKGVWSFPFALILATSGSLLGAALDYAIGVWLSRRLDRLPAEKDVKRWTPLTKEKYGLLLAKFRRHGAIYILINRFLPGIRAFFFIVAGASRMSLWKVLVYAAISAVVWNTLLLGAGYSVGANWDDLRSLFASYTTVVWCLLGVALVGGIGFWLVRKRGRAVFAAQAKSESEKEK
ncbi:MAG: DedA family protein [Deltaproteobacteria bacterium]|nr:DedA family protein [Deltaproteobacteria bacterium]